MNRKTAMPGAMFRLAVLVAALVFIIAPQTALAGDGSVRVAVRSSVTLGLIAGRNDTFQLTAVVAAAGGAETPAVVWTSSAPTVVSVDAAGKLTAHRLGAAVVRAQAGGAYARCIVAVRRLPVRSLALNRRKVTLLAGRDGFQLVSSTAPQNADNPSVTWSSLRPSVALVESQTGFVTPLKPGVAVIQCRAADGSRKKAYCTVYVRPVAPEALALDQPSLKVNVGATATLTPAIAPADATDKRVVWGSSNPSVATVSNGVVTGKAFGKATITAKTRAGGIRATCEVSVGYYTTKFRALLIGQCGYRSSPLDAPYVDIRLVNSMLKNSDYGGGRSVSVSMRENLTAVEIEGALNGLATWGIDSDDVTFFYYSGHGSEADPGALVGVDLNTVSVDRVRQYLDRIPGTVVVMLDSCYAGWYIRDKSTSAGSGASIDPAAVNSRVVSAFAAPSAAPAAKTSLAASTTAAGKYQILTACSSTEFSYIIPGDPYEGSSLFTYYLAVGGGVRANDWEAAKLYADANGNGIVTLTELYRFAQPRVLANRPLRQAGYKQSVRMWPSYSAFPVAQRTP